jgi:hypothetical protein
MFGALRKPSVLLNILTLLCMWHVTPTRKRRICKNLIVVLGTGKAVEVKQVFEMR